MTEEQFYGRPMKQHEEERRLRLFRAAERALLGQTWTKKEADELRRLIGYGER